MAAGVPRRRVPVPVESRLTHTLPLVPECWDRPSRSHRPLARSRLELQWPVTRLGVEVCPRVPFGDARDTPCVLCCVFANLRVCLRARSLTLSNPWIASGQSNAKTLATEGASSRFLLRADLRR